MRLPVRVLVSLLTVGLVATWQQLETTAVEAQSPIRRELTGRDAALHAINRLTFGQRPGDVERVMALGVDRWIDQQLTPGRLSDRAGDAAMRPYGNLDRDPAELREMFPRPGVLQRAAGGQLTAADSAAVREAARAGRAFTAELMSARVARAVASERQLQEVLVDFWLNHFSVFVGKNPQMRYYLPAYERDGIRPHVLGKFRDLLGAVAKSPAMLTYLDNANSVADSTRPTLTDRAVAERRLRFARGAIARRQQRAGARVDSATLERLMARRPKGLNENYARELLELHTLGVDGGYTQQDVIEVARALTGWTVRPGRRSDDGFFFNAMTHDAGEKMILGQRFPAERGESEGDAVLDLLARHPATARHIAHKLAVRFVSDDPSEALVDRVAEVFKNTDGDLKQVVGSLVRSPEFFSRAAWRSKVKSPFEVVVSAVRALGGVADSTPLTATVVARLGQPIYGHQAPDGWPETGDEWMNTGAILNRINFGLAVAGNRVPGARVTAWGPYEELRSAERTRQVDAVVNALFGGTVSAETREILMSGSNPLLAGSAVDSATVDADAGVELSMQGMQRPGRRPTDRGAPPERQGSADSSDMRNRPVPDRTRSLQARSLGAPRPLTGLDLVVGLALGAPEFQRR